MNEVTKREIAPLATGVIESLLIRGDLSKLNEQQRLSYYQKLCESLGLNPLTQPFEYISMNGRLVLYAKRACTDQLRFIHKVSIDIVKRELNENFYMVIAKAKLPDGRTDEAVGVKSVIGLKGDAHANALMSGETKAKRRVTLSICGLGYMDEYEKEDVTSDLPAPTAEEIMSGEREPLEYTIPFGQYKDLGLKEVGENALTDYIKYIKDKGVKQNKPITGKVLDFIERAEAYVCEQYAERAHAELDSQMKQSMTKDE